MAARPRRSAKCCSSSRSIAASRRRTTPIASPSRPSPKRGSPSPARLLPQCAEHLADDGAAGADRVLADFLLLLGHHQVEAVERLLRHVLVEVGVGLVD